MICTFWLENLWKYSTIVTHTFHSFFQANLIGHRYGGGRRGVKDDVSSPPSFFKCYNIKIQRVFHAHFCLENSSSSML